MWGDVNTTESLGTLIASDEKYINAVDIKTGNEQEIYFSIPENKYNNINPETFFDLYTDITMLMEIELYSTYDTIYKQGWLEVYIQHGKVEENISELMRKLK